jgi:hypothetical protein
LYSPVINNTYKVRLSCLFTLLEEKYADIGSKRFVSNYFYERLKIFLKSSTVVVLKLLNLFSSAGQ